MNKVLAFLAYKGFKEQICNNNNSDSDVASNLLLSPLSIPTIDTTDVLVLGNSDKHIAQAKEWCDVLAQESKLHVTHIPNVYRTNDEYVKLLYYILPQKKIKKALIIHCQFYGNCMSIRKKQYCGIYRKKYFNVLQDKYTYMLEALLYFIQTYMLYMALCEYYGIKLIIVDNIIKHNGITWYILRKIYMSKKRNVLCVVRTYKNNLKKIVKFLKRDMPLV
jgi:hypothetical protein